jgi:hypothetical protein
MYHILKFYAICFIKFIVYIINSEMITSEMEMLIGREKADVSDADVAVD